ncbi:MAG: glycosyltransferase family 2 protein [Anaerolineae bacterium]|nr:glycosyltransferase family 2 protein [Anaerolineae bacterium]
MRFSIVIPTYNRRELLRRCLSGAVSQDYPNYEVIVVDDGSTDGTEEIVRREFPQVRYIRQNPNRGPAAARNQGIRASTGEIVAFTDDDCLLPPNFLSRLADGYRRYPQVAGVGGYLEAPQELLESNLFAQYEAYVTHHVYRAGPEEYLGGFECPAGGTNSMSYRREVLLEVGGFDESFPYAAGEDADLKWRVTQKGYLLLYLPVKVTHLQTYTSQHFWRQHQRHGRGAVYFERKHRGHPPSLARLALRFGARMARWIPDLYRNGLTLATVKLVAELADLSGQYKEVKRLRSQSSKTGYAQRE